MSGWIKTAAAVVVALSAHGAFATAADTAKAEQNRRKPLQRCDQLADKAQKECLQKARQRIVEARKKREASGEKRGEPDKTAPAKDASQK